MRNKGLVGTPTGAAAVTKRAAGWSLGLAGKLAAVTAIALTTANCGSQKLASSGGVDSKYGVSASPRVIPEGEPIPKGGGREMVGRPYVVAGRTYVPREGSGYVREGLASWYGTAFHGRLTANGEIFDRESIAAAHPTLPLPSYTRVTNLQNNRSMIVRVNDRGPYHANRVMDVSERVAEALDFKRVGTANIRVEYLAKASTRGSDDSKLMATLRTDGRPASMPGRGSIMLADLREDAPQTRPSIARGSSLAFRAPDPEPVQAEPVQAEPVMVADASPARRGLSPSRAMPEVEAPREEAPVRVARAPVPPERPFDLATIPSAATPLGPSDGSLVATHLPPARPTYAGLFYVEPKRAGASARAADPFVSLKPQRTVSIKRAVESDTAGR